MLKTTVIAKTDWVRSTNLMRRLSSDELDAMLAKHKPMMTDIVHQHEGRVLKGEGDAFWLTFSSVTTACLCALDMQQALRADQLNIANDERLKMRVVINVGDALHREGDLFGVVMAQTARIEGITPDDEIYLSQAAWLTMNHAQVTTEFAETVTLRSFDTPQHIYRVVKKDVIQTENGVVVSSDLAKFTLLVNTANHETLAKALVNYETIATQAVAEHGGRLRAMAGDTFFLTFDAVDNTIHAIINLAHNWTSFAKDNNLDLPLRIGINYGDYSLFRTHFFGNTINNAVLLQRFASRLDDTSEPIILFSQAAMSHITDDMLKQRLQRMDLSDEQNQSLHRSIRNDTVYRLKVAQD